MRLDYSEMHTNTLDLYKIGFIQHIDYTSSPVYSYIELFLETYCVVCAFVTKWNLFFQHAKTYGMAGFVIWRVHVAEVIRSTVKKRQGSVSAKPLIMAVNAIVAEIDKYVMTAYRTAILTDLNTNACVDNRVQTKVYPVQVFKNIKT